MFNILIFQSLYNLSDDDVERELLKYLLARRFVGLSGRQFGPDATTIWRFKEALTKTGALDTQRAGTLVVRCIGLARACVKIGLRNLAYNMDRLGCLAGA